MSYHAEDYLALRFSSKEERGSLISEMGPRAESVQWWLALVEAAETEVRHEMGEGRSAVDALDFAVFLLESGARAGAVSACRKAYWFIRLSRAAIDFGLEPAILPDQLSPDGAARHALSSLPLTPDEAIALSRRLDAEFDKGVDRLPGTEDRALAETGLVLASLNWVYEAIADSSLAAEVLHWLQVYRKMAPVGGS